MAFLSDVLMFKSVKIATTDQVFLQLELFEADPALTVIVNPAIGVKRRMYHHFASFLSERGITVVLYNYRGMEDGLDNFSLDTPLDAETWGRIDQSAVIDWVHQQIQPKKLYLLGHSLGGQIPGFAHNINSINGLLLVAAQKGDKWLWPLSGYLKLVLLWHLLIPWMSKGHAFNAPKLGLGSYPWPASAAKQWASWGQQKDYLFHPKFNYDLRSWHNFNKPILSFGFTDDHMAPEAAIDGLLDEYGRNHDQRLIEKHMVDPHLLGIKAIGHFGFFQPTAQTLWQDTITWITNN